MEYGALVVLVPVFYPGIGILCFDMGDEKRGSMVKGRVEAASDKQGLAARSCAV